MKITVIMPSLNVEKYIGECIHSVLSSSLREIEVLCIDAGSTDGTIDIIKGYARNDLRVRIINSKKKSYGAQVNIGFDEAKGEYISIVETDDYISTEMYESLYSVAKKNGVDYAKGDFQRFYTLKNGERIFSAYKQFPNNTELYNKALNIRECDAVYQEDFNIWKGIYKTDWIKSNNIRLLETAGAAYQDIGFIEQMYLYAKSGYYVDVPLYYYRTDRDEASVNSIKGFYNLYVGFSTFYDEFLAQGKNVYKKGYYIHLIRGFLGEFDKLIIKLNGDIKSSYCEPYLSWFIEKIGNAFEKGYIAYDDFELRHQKQLKRILTSAEDYAVFFWKESEKYKSYFDRIEENATQDVVIFGAGFWGMEFFRHLAERNEKKVVAFADNDIQKQGTMIAGKKVHALAEAIKLYPDAIFIITNRKNSKEMRAQYLESGGNEDNMLIALE